MAPGTAGPGVFLSHRRDMVEVSQSVVQEVWNLLQSHRVRGQERGQAGVEGMAESWGPGCAICPLCACLHSSITERQKEALEIRNHKERALIKGTK